MNDQNLVLWAIDENMGTNLQAFLHRLSENTITFCKNKKKNFFFKFGQGACESGRAQASTGRAQRPQK